VLRQYRGTPPEHQPQAHARDMSSGCGTSVVIDDSDVEWQGGSHIIAGAAVAVSSLGSELVIAMMVGGGGAAPFFGRVAWSRLDPCTGTGTVLIG